MGVDDEVTQAAHCVSTFSLCNVKTGSPARLTSTLQQTPLGCIQVEMGERGGHSHERTDLVSSLHPSSGECKTAQQHLPDAWLATSIRTHMWTCQ